MKTVWVGLICMSALLAEATLWTGGGLNDNWNFGSNWEGGAVPGSNDVAFIRLAANPFQNAQQREVARLAIGITDQEVNLSVGANGGSLTMGRTTGTQNNLGQHTSGTSSVTLQGGAWTAFNPTAIGGGAGGHTDFNVLAGTLTLGNTFIGTAGGTAALKIFGDGVVSATGGGFTFGSAGTLSFEFSATGITGLDVNFLNAAGAVLEVDLSNYTGGAGTFTLVNANRDSTGQDLNSIFSTVNLTEGAWAGSYVTQDQTTDLITVSVIPEPTMTGLLVLGVALLPALRRKAGS